MRMRFRKTQKINVLLEMLLKNSQYFVGVFNKTIILLVLVEYKLSTVSYPTCTPGIIVK